MAVNLNDERIAQAATAALAAGGYIEAERGHIFTRPYLDMHNEHNRFSYDEERNVLTYSDDYYENIDIDCNTLEVINQKRTSLVDDTSIALDEALARRNLEEQQEKALEFAPEDIREAQIEVLETAGLISDNATEEDVERVLNQELESGNLQIQNTSVMYMSPDGKNYATEIPNSFEKSNTMFADTDDTIREASNEVKNGGYQRLTEDIVSSSEIMIEGAKRYSGVVKGWLKNEVRNYQVTENGETFYRAQMLLATKEPIGFKTDENGKKIPEFQKGDEQTKGTKFIFVEMDTKEKVDFSRFENAAEEIAFSGQNCYVSKRNQEGKGIGEKTERFYARSAFVEMKYKGELVRNQDDKPIYEFISPKENSMKNEVSRAGREHERCHLCKTNFDKWNEPERENGKIVAFRHKFNAIYTPKVHGELKRDQDGNLLNNFKTFNLKTKNPLTKEQIAKLHDSNVLSVNYVEHIRTFKDKDNKWQKAHICEATNIGCYLKRNKELEKDPLPEHTYEGEVMDTSIDGFNTKDIKGNLVYHKFSDIDPSQNSKIIEGKCVSMTYDKNLKVSQVKQVEAKTLEQTQSRSK